jgi:hypothetical protein
MKREDSLNLLNSSAIEPREARGAMYLERELERLVRGPPGVNPFAAGITVSLEFAITR